ncbi:MAG: tetratricopeptide repeat protein [Fidelibacterota bacterium]
MNAITQANKLAESGQIVAAKKLFDQCFSTTQDPDALYGLAYCSYAEKNYDLAITQLNEIILVEPHHVEAYNLAGIIAAQTGDYDSAKTLFGAAIEYDPQFVDAQRNYAEILLEEGDYENGLRALQIIMQNFPDDVATLVRMARLYAEVDRHEDAQLLLERARELEPENQFIQGILERT